MRSRPAHLVLIKRGSSHGKSHLHGPVKRGRQTGSTVWRSRWPWARVNPLHGLRCRSIMIAALFHRAYDCLILSIFSSDWIILFSCHHAQISSYIYKYTWNSGSLIFFLNFPLSDTDSKGDPHLLPPLWLLTYVVRHWTFKAHLPLSCYHLLVSAKYI